MALRATKGDEDARCGRTLSSFLVVRGRRAWRFRCFFPCLQPSGVRSRQLTRRLPERAATGCRLHPPSYLPLFGVSSRALARSLSAPAAFPDARRAVLRLRYALAYAGLSRIATSKSDRASGYCFNRECA